MNFLRQLMEVPVTDPDDARRRRILNIILFGMALLCLVAIIVMVTFVGVQTAPELVVVSLVVLVGTLGIYFINRYQSGQFASHLFLISLTILMTLSDTPYEVSTGRSLFSLMLPIAMASMLLGPASSFYYAIFSSLIITVISIQIHATTNVPAILGFFLLGLVSWLSARSLEQVLKELRLTNRELDHRVVERTMDLTKALVRERITAGRNQAILDGIADGVLVFDIQDQIIIANPAFRERINYTQEQLIGQSIGGLIAGSKFREADCINLNELLNHPVQGKSNLRVVWDTLTFTVTAAYVHDSAGEIIGKVAVFHDFTNEAEVENLKSRFVATVSHELRTPLNAVMGYAEMLKVAAFGVLSEKQLNVVERIMTNTHRLLEIVNDILNQAQIEAGRIQIHTKVFKTRDLLEGVHATMDPIAQKKDLVLVSKVEEAFPDLLMGDPDRLQQVLTNLITNAIKFTERGEVHVRFFNPDSAHWAMEVSDTGVGIPREAQKYIFEPFRQVDATATRKYSGVGLGLSIVKNLVTYMGGDIQVSSDLGQGSTFTVTLPLTIDEKETL
jgi:PAS domain S-box-containing protein